MYSKITSFTLRFKPIHGLLASPPCDPEYKDGNMSSWWGPTSICVRCRGKSGWTSSPVGTAQTQRPVQMRLPTPAPPKHACQVKTTPSDPQIDRQGASMPAIVHGLPDAPAKPTERFCLPSAIWSCQKYQRVSDRSVSGFSPCPLGPRWHLSRVSSRHLPREEPWHQLLVLQLMIGGRVFSQVPVSVCPLSIPLGKLVISKRLVGCV